jgi:hypothetical protein
MCVLCVSVCLSLQVVEIAPAPNLAQSIKDALYADAVKLAKHVGYRNAGALLCLSYLSRAAAAAAARRPVHVGRPPVTWHQ